MGKIEKIEKLEEMKRDFMDLEDVEIIIIPKKRLLRWFQSIEKEM